MTGTRVVIRVDSGASIGSGHLMRCLSLGSELRRRGAAVRFVCRELPGHLIHRIEHDGHVVVRLPAAKVLRAPEGGVTKGIEEVSARKDAADTLDAIGADKPDWVIVDHYGLDLEWERTIGSAVDRILTIDDLADRAHECSVLLDQNWYGPETVNRYLDRVPDQCIRLLGPRYALLQPVYAQLRGMLPPRDLAIRRVLIFFGAGDPTDETAKALEALSKPQHAHVAVDVVIGVNHPDKSGIRAKVKLRPQTNLHEDLLSLAGLMVRADLAIGAGGSTTWERLCLGLFTLVTTLAPNQERFTELLATAGLVYRTGQASRTTIDDYCNALRNAMERRNALPQLLVDGFGAQRVGEIIVPSCAAQLSLRRARQQDAVLFLDWRNDATVRAMSFSDDPIPWPTHAEWFQRKLASRDAELFVAEAGGLPVGQLRLDYGAQDAVLSYSLDHLVRGRGWSRWLISQALERARRTPSSGYRAEVRVENEASRQVFKRMGWMESQGTDGRLVYRLPRVPRDNDGIARNV